MDYITIYFVGFILTVAAFAIRAGEVEARPLFVLSLVWPLSLISIVFILICDFFGLNIEVSGSNARFGYRRATGPSVRGFAVTLFRIEVRVYSFTKKVD